MPCRFGRARVLSLIVHSFFS